MRGPFCRPAACWQWPPAGSTCMQCRHHPCLCFSFELLHAFHAFETSSCLCHGMAVASRSMCLLREIRFSSERNFQYVSGVRAVTAMDVDGNDMDFGLEGSEEDGADEAGSSSDEPALAPRAQVSTT